MKSLTCDVCGATVTASSEAEVMEKTMAHMHEQHKEASDKYKAMPQAEQTAMTDKMKALIN